MYDEITPSLVAVQYTVDGEFGRRELIGQGVVIGEEGAIIASLALFPTQIPDEQMKDFKVIIPGDEEKETDAVFLGRDERVDRADNGMKRLHWPVYGHRENRHQEAGCFWNVHPCCKRRRFAFHDQEKRRERNADYDRDQQSFSRSIHR